MPGLVPGIHVFLRVKTWMAGIKPGHDGMNLFRRREKSVLLLAVVVLVEKSLGLHRQMHLVLERRIAAGREQPGIVGDRIAQRLDPRPFVLGEIDST